MPPRLTAWYGKLGRLEKFFLVLLPVDLVFRMGAPASGWGVLASLILYVTGFVILFRLIKLMIGKVIWRLRNRLIVAYLFIAVVPIALILALAGIALYAITGQLAVYLVNSELDRRTAALMGPAEALARTPPEHRQAVVGRLENFLRGRFPQLQVVIQDSSLVRYPEDPTIQPPPPGWGDVSGVILKNGHLFGWAHVTESGREVTVIAPLTHEYLAELVPGVGDVFFLNLDQLTNRRSLGADKKPVSLRLDELEGPRVDRLPPAYMRGDIRITGFSPVPVAFWDQPGKADTAVMVVHTRTSAVLRTVFGRGMNWGETAWILFLVIATVFLIVELVSLFVGISITRTITGAVHELYLGTQRVKEGDFTHRIPVRGSDQLAELGISFNTMTENLGNLIVVAKEKERLQSELEIAREVQKQLFPKDAPHLRTLEMAGLCNPARMVSGDYYDFMALRDSTLAFAIGDVAGKGISAALLMAAIQSTMRTQLAARMSVAVAAGNGGSQPSLSAAQLVSQLNKQLYANTAPEKYATFCFAIYDDRDNTLTYTNAGHLPPILVRNGSAKDLEITGTVVGAFPFVNYEEKQLRLMSGDLLVAYTDGITEPENEYGEMFGEERLKDVLVKHSGQDSNEIIARVMEAVERWTGTSEPQDDMTLLLARRI